MNIVNLFFDTNQIVLQEDIACQYSEVDYISYMEKVGSNRELSIFDEKLLTKKVDLLLAQFNASDDISIKEKIDEYGKQEDLGFFLIQYITFKEPEYFIMSLPGKETMFERLLRIKNTCKTLKEYNCGIVAIRKNNEIESFFYYGSRKKTGKKAGKKFFRSVFVNYTEEKWQADNLRYELMTLPYSDGPVFERLVQQILKTCFAKVYKEGVELKTQVTNLSKTDRRDIQITNRPKCSNDFLNQLRSRDNVDILLFDAKNYREELVQTDMTRFKSYLDNNTHFGNLGIIVTRMGITEKAKVWRNEQWLHSNKKIIVLTDKELMKMLQLYGEGEDATVVIEDKYYEIISEM
ncbi:hypothetical protein [Paenibacillus camerounensis]|uniref:hypothetical protein n=1 Tax=Paenibacillus camerounensis TaxID=1243663 RepID=UPI0005A821BB|nr:hypothetical protein [Paenibacillus camerounensis]